MQPYPLYDKLLADVKSKDMKNIDMIKLSHTINNIALLEQADAQAHYEEIQAIILHHDMLHNGKMLLTVVPNDGKLLPGGKSILYTLIKLPTVLQQILLQYIDHYTNTL